MRILPLLLFLTLTLAACSRGEDAANYFQQATERFASGEYGESVVLLKNALRQDPGNPAAWKLLAAAEERRGNLEEAYYSLTKARELAPDDREVLVKLGNYLLAGNNLKDTLPIVERLRTLAPNDAETRLLAATLDLHLGNHEQAEKLAAAVRRQHPDSDRAVFIEATALIARKRHQRAEDLLRAGVARFPDNLPLATLRIENLQRLGRTDAALAEIDRLYQATGRQADLLLAKARLLERHGRTTRAEQVYRQLITAHPDAVAYRLHLARFLFRHKRQAAAWQFLDRELDAGPPAGELLRLYAYLASATDRIDAARQHLTRLSDAHPGDPAYDPARRILAGLLLDQGQIDAAAQVIDGLLARTPNDYEALVLHGEILRHRGRLDDAVATLRRASGLQPRNSLAWLALGATHEAAHRPLLAREAYETALQRAPNRPDVIYHAARFHFRRGDYHRADQILERPPAAEEVPPRQVLLRAAVKLKLRQWQQAEEILRDLERRHPDRTLTEVELLRGELFRQQRRWEESITTYRRLVKRFPGQQQPLAALVRSYVTAGRLDEAEAFLRSVIAVYPDNTFARLLLAQRLLEKPDRPAARQLLEATLKRNPDEPMTYILLARLLRESGRLDAADRVLGRWAARGTWHPGIVFEQARIAEARGDRPAAIAAYRTILRRHPGQRLAANNLATLLVEGKPATPQLTEALKVSAVLRDSVNPWFLDTWAWVRLQAGKPEAARGGLLRAIRLLPDEPLFHHHLARVHQALGDSARARNELQTALRLARQRGNAELANELQQELAALEGQNGA